MYRVGGVGAGELVDAFQTVGHGPHTQGKPPGRLRRYAARVEVRGEGVDEWLRAAAGLLQRAEGAEDQVGHGLPITGEDGIHQEVGGAQDGCVKLQAFSQIEGVEGLLVGLHDTARTGLRAADGDLAALGGGVGLFGEEGQDLFLVAGGDADKASVLRGEQDAAVAEPADQGTLHLTRHGIAFVVRGRSPSHRDGVLVGQAQPEPLCALGEAAQVAAPVQQVVDELTACGLFLPYGLALRPLVALGEGVDRLCRGREHVVEGSGARIRPVRPGGGQVRADQSAQPQTRLRGPLTQRTAGIEFVAGQPTAGSGGLCEDLGVPVQISLGYALVLLGHAHPSS
ncbi:hypothetical protein STSP_73400 [Streptomyces jeddahensis]|uniref:Uncharacterized protein n=1 Tax=Streptomyces jeddahensis TaxID=1716141 RepID=A0A177HEG6_9ACTN|nr:hypothetical protein STSP_73400 [Streptomyces jeddahensis]